MLEQRRLLATLTVNSAADNLTASDGLVTLREAIIAANGDSATDLGDTGSGADTIVFDSSLNGTPIMLTIAGTDENAAADGDLDITSEVAIQGNGQSETIIDAGGAGGLNERVLHVLNGGNLTLESLTVTGGTATFSGGGIYNSNGGTLTLTGSTLSGNSTGASAGGLFNSGTATLTDSTLSGNSAGLNAGGFFSSGTLTLTGSTIAGNTAGARGGGLFNTGTATFTGSTLSGNSASIHGGGLFNSGTATFTGSTVSGNSAGQDGGGISNSYNSLTVVNSTITGNVSDSDGDGTGTGGGLWTYDSFTFSTLVNTIVAGNLVGAGTIPSDIAENDLEAASVNNLIGDPASAGGLAEGTDGNLLGDGSGTLLPIGAILDPLADNGGPTMTHALASGSRAIDAGSNANATVDGMTGSTALTTDQRGDGFDRIQNGTVDIGSFERQVATVSVADVSMTEGDSGTTTFTFDVTLDTAVGSDFTFDFTTVADSAGAGSDFTATMGSGTIIAGQAGTTITVDVIGDTSIEADEQFFVDVSVDAGSQDVKFGPDAIDAVALSEIDLFDTPGFAFDVEIVGNTAYVADRGDGLRVLSISDPANVSQIGFFDMASEAQGVAVVGNTAYVANGFDGLRVLDVSTPGMITQLGAFNTPGFAFDVEIVGDTAYVADGNGGLQVLNVSNPAMIASLGSLNTSGQAHDVKVVGDTAYVAADSGGLRVLDVSNPAMITQLGFFPTSHISWNVELIGDTAYVADGFGGLQVLDVSNPGMITQLGVHDTPDQAVGVAVIDGIAYVGDNASGLRALDVRDPAMITELGFLNTPVANFDVEVIGGVAYVAGGGSGLQVIDIDFTTRATGTIENDDAPALVLSIAAAEISEGAGAAVTTATVTRTTDTTNALTVNLSSNDTTEATVPASVTIPAGQMSATFDIDAVDDAIVDGTQTVTITASAAAHTDGIGTVDVTDDDVAMLTLTIAAAAIGEGDGAAATTATVTRNTDTTNALTVNLSSDDTTEATVPASVTIPAGQTSATFDIDAVDDAIVDGTQMVTITTSAAAHTDGSDTLDVTDDDFAGFGIDFTLFDNVLSEGGTSSTFSVSLTAAPASNVVFNVTSSDTGEATVSPASLTFSTGDWNVPQTVTVTGVDDSVVDGDQMTIITLSIDNDLSDDAFDSLEDSFSVTTVDDDVAMLTLTVAAASISEGGGAAATTATVTRNTDTTSALTVNLSSNDTTEATVPASVTIPAGQMSATFDIDAVDDAIVDGTQTVTITASAAAHTDGSDTVDVTDDDVAMLTLTIAAAAISEGDGAAATTATVTRNTDTTSALTVNLSSDDTTEATLPASVTIPAGQASATFDIDAVEDAIVDGTQMVTITASATGHNDGINMLDVTDNDNAAVTVEDVTATEGGNLTFTVTLDNAVQGAFDVDVSFTDGLATGGTDYGNTVVTLNFAGSASETQQFTVTTTDDAVLEGTEDFTVNLDATNALVTDTDTATGTITDNESATIEFALASSSVSENAGAHSVTVNLVIAAGVTLQDAATLSVSAVDLDTTAADYTLNTSSITFAAGSGNGASETVTITPADDALLEGDEDVRLDLAITSGVATLGAQGSHTVTIQDGDTATADLSVQTPGDEAGPVDLVYTVTLDKTNNTGVPITFDIDDLLTGTATSGDDYTAIAANAQISVLDGASTGVLIVPVTDDGLLEATETVDVQISNSSNAAVTIGTSGVTANIIDNDSAEAGLSVTTNGDEDGPVDIVFTVTLDKTNNTGTAITFDLDDLPTGSASPGNDYTAITGVAQISVFDGASTGVLTLPVTDDGLLEATETVDAQIFNSSSAAVTIGTETATATITDNDSASVTVDNAAAAEGNGLTFTVTLDNAVQGGFDVGVSFTDGLATGGTDFDNAAVTLNFAGSAGETQQFTVTTTDDAVLEGTEDFTVHLDATNGQVSDTDTATGTITDNAPAAIHGIKFEDINGNSIRDDGEPGAGRLRIRTRQSGHRRGGRPRNLDG